AARMRQGPGEPPDRDALQPGADQADRVAADIDAVVAVRKGRGDIAEPAGEMKAGGGQKRQNPDYAADAALWGQSPRAPNIAALGRRDGMQRSMPSMPETPSYSVVAAVAVPTIAALFTAATGPPGPVPAGAGRAVAG